MVASPLWKPLLRRAVTGRWGRLKLVPEEPPMPAKLSRLGLYLHVPFCRNLCPFCPYNRFPYNADSFAAYERAVHQEIDLYATHMAGSEVISLYVGGGTPTVNLPGLLRIVSHLRGCYRIGEICIELHPNSMDDACLADLRSAGITMLSVGAQSTDDRLLEVIGRQHDGRAAMDAVRRAARAGFASVNVDLMFALPGQTLEQWRCDVRRVVDGGSDQVSTYPLFGFPYSDLGQRQGLTDVQRPRTRLLLQMLEATGAITRDLGMHRCAVWSWIRPAHKKFSSVSRHHYIGFGPSAASMIGSHFYVNTFHVDAYASTLPVKRPTALCLKMDRRLEMAYWLYWRMYEMFAGDRDFRNLFGEGQTLRGVFGGTFLPFQLMGLVERCGGGYRVTDPGAFWIHRLQNEYSLAYINRLWGRCRQVRWPEGVTL